MLDNHWIWLLMAIAFSAVIVVVCTAAACVLLAAVLKLTGTLRPQAAGSPGPSSRPPAPKKPRSRRRRS